MNDVQDKFYEVVTYVNVYITIIMAIIGLLVVIYACFKLIKMKDSIKEERNNKLLIAAICIMILLLSAGNLYNGYRTISPLDKEILLDAYSLTIINNKRYYENSMRSIAIAHIALVVCLFNRIAILKNKRQMPK